MNWAKGGFLLVVLATRFESASAQCPSGNEIAKIIANDASPGDQFGESIAVFDDIALIGAKEATGNVAASGAAYIFEESQGRWVQVEKLSASDGNLDDRFGFSVALHGDVAVIGAPNDDVCESKSGSAYVFERLQGEWVETAKLTPSNCELGQDFGASVAASAEYLIVGARGGKSDPGGAVYVFVDQDGSWVEDAKLP